MAGVRKSSVRNRFTSQLQRFIPIVRFNSTIRQHRYGDADPSVRLDSEDNSILHREAFLIEIEILPGHYLSRKEVLGVGPLRTWLQIAARRGWKVWRGQVRLS